jgi:hypothetical protein
MTNDIQHRILTIRDSMTVSAKGCFTESAIGDLRSLIKVTSEFFQELQQFQNVGALNENMRYAIHSVFSEIDAFCIVSATYRVLIGAEKSSLRWPEISVVSFTDQFSLLFNTFLDETNFENQCRILLDLFKLQIVFAGMLYE